MKRIFYRHGRWMSLLLLLLLGLTVTPVNASNQVRQQKQATTNLSANIYLPTQALRPIFQNQINQQVASLSGGMITDMLKSLPSADQGWARDMAGALIQPSATLSQLTPQNGGLATSVKLSLYPGDPTPTNASMLVTFSVRDASTIQVSAQPVPGSPQLASGPLTTFSVPLGELQSINTTPDCGIAGLNANIQLPVAFTASRTSNQNQNSQVAHSVLPDHQTLAYSQQSQVA